MANVTMRQLLEAGAHFGHRTRYWNPRMEPYIFGERNKIHIINLEQTLPMLRDACNFLGHLASNGGCILFVGTKRAAREAIESEARRCGMPYVSQRWLGGTLTNFKTIKQSVKRLGELEKSFEDGTAARLPKKEQLSLAREVEKLRRSLGGIKDMPSLPDCLFMIDVGYEKNAVREAQKLGIPIVAVVDSNNDPQGIGYVIPGNDDATRAIRVYCQVAADAILEARGASGLTRADEFVEVIEESKPARSRRKGPRKAEAKAAAKAEAKAEVAGGEPEPATPSEEAKA